MRVAVTGATGKTGRAVLAALTGRGVPVRALARSVPGTDATSARVDLDTGEVLTPALAGCDAVYLLAPNVHPDEPGLVARVLAAAHEVGVHRVVYHSVAQPYAPAMPHHLDKAAAEDLVRRSALAWTVLQPCAYVQNLTDALRGPAPALRVPYSPDTPFNLVDLQDVAQAAATVLVGDPAGAHHGTDVNHGADVHHGATYELGGPRPVSVRDVATAAATVLGRPVPVERTDVRTWLAGPGATLPAHERDRLAAMFEYYDRHGLRTGPLPLRALLGRPPTDVVEVLTRELTGTP